MRRLALLLVILAGISTTGCGDPLVVLGESPNTVRIIAGIGDSAGIRVDSLATHSRYNSLGAITFDEATNLLYVTDRGSNRVSGNITTQVGRIFSITSAGHVTQILDGGGCAQGGPCLIQASDMVRGDGNTLVIADEQSNRVFQFDFSTRALSVLAGNGAATNAVEGAAAASTPINGPTGVVRDADGTLYVSESRSGRVLRIGGDGTYHVVAGGGTVVTGAAPVPATSVLLKAPGGLAIANGALYFVDHQLNDVFALNLAAGTIVRIAGANAQGFSGDGGDGTNALLSSPTDVDLDASGHTLFISDTGNNRVRQLNLDTNILTTYMGSGSAVFNGDHIAAGAVSLKTPTIIKTSSLGFLFVVDVGHSVVRRATLTL